METNGFGIKDIEGLSYDPTRECITFEYKGKQCSAKIEPFTGTYIKAWEDGETEFIAHYIDANQI